MPKQSWGLWQVIDGEPHLIGEKVDTSWEGRWFCHQITVDGKTMLESPPVPLRRGEIRDDDVLSTGQVAYLAGCHRLTVLRHVDRGTLRVHKVSKSRRVKGAKHNTFYFLGEDVLKWIDTTSFTRGRPLKEDATSSGATSKTARRKGSPAKRISKTRRKR